MVTLALASAQYFGVFLQGQKVGYAFYETKPTFFAGKSAELSRSFTSLKIGLIGSEVEIVVDSETVTVAGKTKQMKFVTTSGGRKQSVIAAFSEDSILCSVDNGGTRSKSTLKFPKDGRIFDDPISAFNEGSVPVGKALDFYIFDPSTVSLQKNRAFRGQPENHDGTVLTPIVVEDPRLTTKLYVSGKGDLIRVSTSIGVEMRPLPMIEAMGESSGSSTMPDLAELTAIKPVPALKSPQHSKKLTLRIAAENLKQVPNSDFQSAAKEGSSWIVTVTSPSKIESKPILIAAKLQPGWTKPSHLIPSDNAQMIALAKKIISGTSDVAQATEKIRKYVNSIMTPDAGIGILRDANEVLKSKIGVCCDYAILTATLCRAAKIPTKLASGLVSFDGTFYYHAWVEVFTGSKWVPIDSIPSTPEFSATHVKLAEGNVDSAFAFTVLSRAKIEILEQK